MLGKSKSTKQSPTMKQFQFFIKKRNEKNNIIRSENQSVNAKVKCFEQLIHLNRKGHVVAHSHRDPEETPHYHSSKNIAQVPLSRFAEIEEEKAEMAFGKLNRMATQIKSWQVSKQSSNHHLSNKQFFITGKGSRETIQNSNEKKDRKIICSSTNNSRAVCQGNSENKNWFSKVEAQGQYFPIPKKKKTNLTKHPYFKKYHDYQQSTPNLHINLRNEEFPELKQQIHGLEKKAKQCFGISFKHPKEDLPEFTETSPLEQPEVTRAFSRVEARKVESDNYLQLKREHTKEDTSVPSHFLGMIRNEGRVRPMTHQGWRRYLRI